MAEFKRRLELTDDFTFACHSGLECYTSCCRDVNIFLSPHDVMRLKNAIGIDSGEFLASYTDIVSLPGKVLPMVQLRMDPDNNKKCFFVRPHGCTYYEHRPWACRMFPLDEHGEGGYAVSPSPERCHGLVKGDPWGVKDWLKGQGAIASKEADGQWESLATNQLLNEVDSDNPQIQQMIIMALFDLDRFRDFVFNSSFLDRFDVEQDKIDAVKIDEMALMDLGFAWVRFGLLGQKTLKLKGQGDKGKAAAK